MTHRPLPAPLRFTAALTGMSALSAAFVLAPAFTTSATTAPAASAAAKPVAPTTRTVPLRAHAVVTADRSGPATSLPAGAFTNAPRRVIDRTGLTGDAVVDVPATGDLIGVTWPTKTPGVDGLTVLVRAKTPTGWQPWHRVTIDATSAADATQVGTEPVWEPGAQRVQVRVAAADKALLATASLASVTAPGAASDSQLTPTAVPGAASAAYRPTVISRAQWGAKESLRTCAPTIDPTTKAVIVHHTADSNSYAKADSARMLRSILAYETGTLGWCDMAYNAIVDKYGQIFEGRAGGLDRTVRGAHAYSFNNGTFGASILGNYDTTPVPAAGFDALARVIAMRVDAFYLDPFAKVRLTSSASGGTGRYPAGTTVTLNLIGGHRDTSYTICPGRYLYPRLGELRTLVSKKLTYRNSPVYKKYVAAGGAPKIGAVAVGETTAWTGTRATVYTSGKRIYAGPTGAHLIGPAIAAQWLRLGGAPALGSLATDETSTKLGSYVQLSSGRYLTTATGRPGAALVNGGILAAWLRGGGPTSSPYGMATGAQVSGPTAWWQAFTNGHIYATRTGRVVGTIGALDSAYFANGGPTGPLGLPTATRVAVGGGFRQTFEHGTITVTSTVTSVVRR